MCRRAPPGSPSCCIYVHVACTGFLTAMHTGDRTKEAINAGQVAARLPGAIVRDGYKGYRAPHQRAARLVRGTRLRDLAGPAPLRPGRQVWARAMADLLIDANAAAAAARAAGRPSLDERRARLPSKCPLPRRRRQGHRR